MAARVITNAAQKGGVGKSTFTIQGALFAKLKLNARVLLIDVDPQCNSSGVFVTHDQISDNPQSVASLLYTENIDVTPIIGKHGVDVIPGDDGINAFPQDYTDGAFAELISKLAKADDNSANEVIREVVDHQLVAFAQNIARLQEQYDYIFIDVPPSFLGLPLISSLCAATDVVGLVEPTKFSSDVVGSFIDKVEQVRSQFNHDMTFHGFIINKFRPTTVRHKERVAVWQKEYPDFFMGTPVKVNAWIETCTEDGQPVWRGANNSSRRDGAKTLLLALGKVLPNILKKRATS